MSGIGAMPSIGFRPGATWRAVTRAANVTYTNDTPFAIGFRVSTLDTSGTLRNCTVSLTVNGENLGTSTAIDRNNAAQEIGEFAIVPPGATYSWSGLAPNGYKAREFR